MSIPHRKKGLLSFQQCVLQLKMYLLLSIMVFTALTPNASLATTNPNNKLEVGKETVVYVTRTGEKYHRGSCRYLSKSKIETSLKDAQKNGYAACKVCKP
ncbi:hypothetical protein H8S90_15100 [Olivibacter sp. SDN3]|uniref:hypothetical protein n=1 Tax=Olivibacter sp. SDN3 TaxID=2764720 RepID=UPI001650F06E|nr:hypothetical protein [Olivibacter sp. SDN3]QNL48131.1 hypothetical protein H8S90_15100 [Olivibacter sp. SDN3]